MRGRERVGSRREGGSISEAHRVELLTRPMAKREDDRMDVNGELEWEHAVTRSWA